MLTLLPMIFGGLFAAGAIAGGSATICKAVVTRKLPALLRLRLRDIIAKLKPSARKVLAYI